MRKLSMEELERKTPEEFREAEKTPLIVILEKIRSAYNVGSVFRTSDAFLVQAIYLVGYTATPPHKEIRKTALGAEETVEWKHFATSAEAVAAAKEDGFRVYAVEQAAGSLKLQDMEPAIADKIAILFGNETTGVEQDTIGLCDGCL